MDDMDVSDAHFPGGGAFCGVAHLLSVGLGYVRFVCLVGWSRFLVEKLELEKLGVSKNRSMDGTDEDNQEDPNNGVSM